MAVVGTPRLLGDCEGALSERLGLSVAVLVLIEFGQIVDRDGHIRVVGARHYTPSPQSNNQQRDVRAAGCANNETKAPCSCEPRCSRSYLGEHGRTIPLPAERSFGTARQASQRLYATTCLGL